MSQERVVELVRGMSLRERDALWKVFRRHGLCVGGDVMWVCGGEGEGFLCNPSVVVEAWSQGGVRVLFQGAWKVSGLLSRRDFEGEGPDEDLERRLRATVERWLMEGGVLHLEEALEAEYGGECVIAIV